MCSDLTAIYSFAWLPVGRPEAPQSASTFKFLRLSALGSPQPIVRMPTMISQMASDFQGNSISTFAP